MCVEFSLTIMYFIISGTAEIENVEFDHMGQRGLTEWDDPRFGVAFVSTKTANNANPGHIIGCSFHDGYSTNIGAFDALNLRIHKNVVVDSYEACKLKPC